MTSAILIQARMSSSRFPNKMMAKVGRVTLLEFVYNRCKKSKIADKVVVLTSVQQSDDVIAELCFDKKIPLFRGDLDDVLKRYICAADYNNAETICRVCGDSPFVDISAVDEMLSMFSESKCEYDYVSVVSCINGFVSEVFTRSVLKEIYTQNLSESEKEHVTSYIVNNKENFNTNLIGLDLKPKGLDGYTLTVDYPNDIALVNSVVDKLIDDEFTSADVIDALYAIGI